MIKNFLLKLWSFIKHYRWIFSGATAVIIIGVVSLIIVLNHNGAATVPIAATVNVSSSSIVSETSSTASSEVTSSEESSSSQASSSSEVTSSGPTTSSVSKSGSNTTATTKTGCVHSWKLTLKDIPTCDKGAYDIYECTKCGKTEKRNYRPPEHLMTIWKTSREGYNYTDGEEERHCMRCPYYETRKVPSPAKQDRTGSNDKGSWKLKYVEDGDFTYYIYDYRTSGGAITTSKQSNQLTVKVDDGGGKVATFTLHKTDYPHYIVLNIYDNRQYDSEP